MIWQQVIDIANGLLNLSWLPPILNTPLQVAAVNWSMKYIMTYEAHMWQFGFVTHQLSQDDVSVWTHTITLDRPIYWLYKFSFTRSDDSVISIPMTKIGNNETIKKEWEVQCYFFWKVITYEIFDENYKYWSLVYYWWPRSISSLQEELDINEEFKEILWLLTASFLSSTLHQLEAWRDKYFI